MAARFVQTGGHRKAVRSVKSAAVDTLLAVNGTLMRGLALNGHLLAAGATFVREARTAPLYRLWSIGDRHPAMLRVASGGAAIAVEGWSGPAAGLAGILAKEPPGLCIRQGRLHDRHEGVRGLRAAALLAGEGGDTPPR